MGGESCSKRKGGGSDSGDKREGWKIWQQDDAEDKIKSDTTHRSLGSEKRRGGESCCKRRGGGSDSDSKRNGRKKISASERMEKKLWREIVLWELERK